MAITATLGSLDISGYLRDNPSVGGATREWEEVGGAFADVSRQVGVHTSGLIEIVLPLKVSAATADLLIAALAALRAETTKDTNTLHIKPTGATNETHFSIVKNPHLSVPFDNTYDVGKVALFDLVLMAHPWGYADAVTAAIHASNQNLPGGFSFEASGGTATTILGDTPTPLTITAVPNSDASIHCFWAGWYPNTGAADAPPWTGYLVETDTAGSWVGGTAAAGPTTNAHPTGDPKSVKNTSADASYLPIDTAAYDDHTYLVLARVCLESADDTATFYLASSSGILTDTVTYDPNSTEWQIIELGTVVLPVQDTASGTAANLRVYMECSDAAQYVAMDWVGFVPIDNGLCCYHPATETTAAASLVFAGPKVYVDGIVDYTHVSGHGIKAVGVGTLVIFADHDNANAGVYAATLDVDYTARFELWR